ncbi:MAG: hypothetical protein AB1603_00515 [Chloroflexota bacterium]
MSIQQRAPGVPNLVVKLFSMMSSTGLLTLVKGPLRPAAEPVLRLVARSGLLRFSPGTHALISALAKPGVLASVKDVPSSQLVELVKVLAKPGVAEIVNRTTPSIVVDLIKTLRLPGALTNFQEMAAEEIVHIVHYLVPSEVAA